MVSALRMAGLLDIKPPTLQSRTIRMIIPDPPKDMSMKGSPYQYRFNDFVALKIADEIMRTCNCQVRDIRDLTWEIARNAEKYQDRDLLIWWLRDRPKDEMNYWFGVIEEKIKELCDRGITAGAIAYSHFYSWATIVWEGLW